MAAVAIPPSARKRKIDLFDFKRDTALSFVDGIESSWKGHEPFAMWLVQHLKPKTIVDLGFDRGLSTIAFAYKNKGQVFGVDWFDSENYATKCFALDSAFRNISNAIRISYAKNIHLIVGSYKDVLKNWTKKIDLLHICFAHTYQSTKLHYENWTRFLNPGGVILIHGIHAFPDDTGRFFQEISLPKWAFSHASGLGVVCSNSSLIEEIKAKFSNLSPLRKSI